VNLAALVEYDGTRFAGFQRQAPDKGPTVQGAIEEALERIAGAALVIEAAGRTDSGVHAMGQVISFHASERLDAQAWQRALNALLPPDIAVRAIRQVCEEFRARRCARSRSYAYRILCDAVRSPLREHFMWRVPRQLDVEAMDAAAACLLGEHDFGAFGSSPHDRPAEGYRARTVRVMSAAQARRVGKAERTGEIALLFTANAFLTGMVRRLVGTLVLVGDGRLAVEDFRAILEAGEKGHRGAAAPAHGLCLISVEYPPELLFWGELGHLEDWSGSL
jgi:tRNA pseudouridine38-40 synthase